MSSPGVRFVDCTPWSVGWIAPTPRAMQRTSHAIAVDGRVWFLDPVDDPEAIARGLELGEPAGVVQLLDRHNRDCDSIAGRLGVPLYRLPTTTPDGAPFVPISVVDSRLFRWHEVALWFPALRALVVAEALGTASYFRARGEWVGPHPLLRLARPPRVLSSLDPDHVRFGHGAGRSGPGLGDDLRDAVRLARRSIPSWLIRLARTRGR